MIEDIRRFSEQVLINRRSRSPKSDHALCAEVVTSTAKPLRLFGP